MPLKAPPFRAMLAFRDDGRRWYTPCIDGESRSTNPLSNSVDGMNQIQMTRKVRGWPRAIPAALLLAMGACGNDPAAVELDGDRYVDETFEVDRENDIQYGAAMDETGAEEALLLDLYQPADDTLAQRPAVMWIHGGSFQQGHRGETADFARSSARRGFVSVSLSYRLRENQVFDYTDPDDLLGETAKRDAQHDIQAAVRWLRAAAADLKIDPDRIFLAGYSAGGTAALRVAAASPEDTGSSGNPEQSSSVRAVVAISASIETGMLEAAQGRTLLIHGTDDTKVPLAQVQAACAAVDLCDLVTIQGGVHNMITSAHDDIISETARFLAAAVAP